MLALTRKYCFGKKLMCAQTASIVVRGGHVSPGQLSSGAPGAW